MQTDDGILSLNESVQGWGRKKKDSLGFFTVYNARRKNTEGYHLANIHHGNLKTCIQKATSIIPVPAGRSERMHVFYSSETIPPKMSQKKISSEALTFKDKRCLSSRCPALTSPYDCLNSIDTHMSPRIENHSIVMYVSRRKVQSGHTSKAKTWFKICSHYLGDVGCSPRPEKNRLIMWFLASAAK
jgi:hypothetical protein